MFKKKITALLMGTMLVGTLVVGCGSSDDSANGGSTVTISGSTSVGPSIEAISEAYKTVKPEINLEIQQLGSSAGIKNAIDGISEIGMSSRDLKDEEKASGITEEVVALEAISVILNNTNGVDDLSMDQIKDIFTGNISNWSEVGGVDAPIVVVSREDGSGARGTFEEVVGYENELTVDAQIGDGSGNIKSIVAGNENSIGYIASYQVDDSVKQISVNGAELTTENAQSGAYPISGPCILVYKEDAISQEGKALLDYILSTEGQDVMEQEGLIRVN